MVGTGDVLHVGDVDLVVHEVQRGTQARQRCHSRSDRVGEHVDRQ